MRLLSVDGTRLVLPNHKSVVEEFGEHSFGPNADSKRSLALASFLYDSLNLITLDAQIAPYSSSERDLLCQHLEKVKSGDSGQAHLLQQGQVAQAAILISGILPVE